MIQDLYKKIPKFTCIEGCSACCGIVPIALEEAQRLNLTQPLLPINLRGECIYSSKEGCTVYEKRPLICRLFGVVEHPNMKCPKGGKAERVLSAKEEKKILSKYMREVNLGSL